MWIKREKITKAVDIWRILRYNQIDHFCYSRALFQNEKIRIAICAYVLRFDAAALLYMKYNCRKYR